MKQKDVKIGGEYETKVCGSLVRVKVQRSTEDTFSGRTKFVVVRVDNGRVLDKARAASALRPI